MSFHHVAITTKDMSATHEFYAQAMGFSLVRVEKARFGESAWAKHFFYDTGDGEMLAVWELHDEALDPGYSTSISEGLGLPRWTNHIAFGSKDKASLDEARVRLNKAGHVVTEIDHDWCSSIYATDPNGIMVEFCTTTRAFVEADKRRALAALTSDALEDNAPPKITMHAAID